MFSLGDIFLRTGMSQELKCYFCRSQWKPRQDDGSKKGMQDEKVSPPCASVPLVKRERTSAVV